MTATTPPITSPSTRCRLARFVGHYLEMVAAMVVGMVVLAPLGLRRHSWPRIVEMCVVMAAPFAVLLVPPHWLGALSGGALMIAAHVIMFPLMLAAMVWRRAGYGL